MAHWRPDTDSLPDFDGTIMLSEECKAQVYGIPVYCTDHHPVGKLYYYDEAFFCSPGRYKLDDFYKLKTRMAAYNIRDSRKITDCLMTTWKTSVTGKFVPPPKEKSMTYDAGVVRAFRIITIDEIKPGMTLLDTHLGRERVVESISTTVKNDEPKSVRILFKDGKYAGLKYQTFTEQLYYNKYYSAPTTREVVRPNQTRFKEAYDLNINRTILRVAREEAQKIVNEAILGQQDLQHGSPTPEKKKRRWFR